MPAECKDDQRDTGYSGCVLLSAFEFSKGTESLRVCCVQVVFCVFSHLKPEPLRLTTTHLVASCRLTSFLWQLMYIFVDFSSRGVTFF